MDYEIRIGDCRELMKKLGDGNIDAVVTDPPYELGFMGKSWDRTGIAYQVDVWREVLRVLNAIEDAGFELRDTICHVFGSGFPKSLDVSKAIDDAAGAKREVIGVRQYERKGTTPVTRKATSIYSKGDEGNVGQESNLISAPTTEAAQRWEGWGTALKPAAEFWTVARKPLEGTVAQNVLRHQTGALNIEACRIGDAEVGWAGKAAGGNTWNEDNCGLTKDGEPRPATGRWPPNFVMSHAESCGEDCAPSCPVAQMDRQSGESFSSRRVSKDIDAPGSTYSLNRSGITPRGHNDSGGASRFFPCFRYEAKAGRRERDEGLGELPRRSAGEVTNRKDGTAGLKSPRAGAGRTGGKDGAGVRNTHPT